METRIEDPDLMMVLEKGTNEDLGVLIDIITDNGDGRVSLNSDVKETLVAMKNALSANDINADDRIITRERATYLITKEIQSFGGNSIMNFFREGKGIPYKEIVCDVASHVGASYDNTQDIAQIEGAILVKIIEKSIEKMTDDERKRFFESFGVSYGIGAGPAAMAALIATIRVSGFAFYQMATIVAQAVAKQVLGKGLSFATTGGLMRGISFFAGPIGWTITGIWSAYDLASPAYRVTVPCVVQLAYMRQQELMRICPSCKTPMTKDTKFCSECGYKF